MLRVINVRPFKATLKVKVSAAFRCPDRPYYYPGKREAKASASVMSRENGSFHSQSLCFGRWYRAFEKSRMYTLKAVALTIHLPKAKSNVSIGVEAQLSGLTFELRFP